MTRSPSLIVRYEERKAVWKGQSIQSFPYGLSIMVPGPISCLPVATWANRKMPKNQLIQMPLLDFIDPEFLLKLSKNSVMALSHGRIDSDDVFALTPCGRLILNVTKETYERLGLEGKRSQFSGRDSPVRYQISINLKEAGFAPGNKLYDRVKWSFTNVIPQPFPFTVLDPTVLLDDQEKEQVITQKEYASVPTPPLSSMNLRELVAEKRYEMLEILEWIGMVELEGERLMNSTPVDPYLSVYAPPPDSVSQILSSFKLTGLLYPEYLQFYIDQTREMVKSGKLPWAYISILGTPDAPVSWGLKEHGYHQSGENDLILLVNSQGTLAVKVVGDADEIAI